MDFSITREELLHGLHLTQGIVERRTTIPILANVLLESTGGGVLIAATDQEVGVRRRCNAKVKKKGALTTSARKLYEIVRECPEGDIELRTLENNWIEVASGKTIFKIVGLDPKEFPAMPGAPTGKDAGATVVPVALLREMIERTQFAMSIDDGRLNLNGILFERPEAGKLRLVATDGHRLSMVTRPVEECPEGAGVIVPRKGVSEISKVIEGGDEPITLTMADNLVHAQRAGVDLSIRLVEGEFPDYRQVVPERSERRMQIVAEELLAALRRVSVVSSERTRGVRMQLNGERLEVSSVNPDLGEATEEMSVEYDGAPFSIGFNVKYFIDVLGVLAPGTHVEVVFNDEVSPAVVRCEGDPGFVYVIMPMRL
ncbi:DNA polymerase III subunit beta [Candidatus Binatia bacterium]|nr:DNA polymerase III subunit beta [Candidatus Binatia bacterium]